MFSQRTAKERFFTWFLHFSSDFGRFDHAKHRPEFAQFIHWATCVSGFSSQKVFFGLIDSLVTELGLCATIGECITHNPRRFFLPSFSTTFPFVSRLHWSINIRHIQTHTKSYGLNNVTPSKWANPSDPPCVIKDKFITEQPLLNSSCHILRPSCWV